VSIPAVYATLINVVVKVINKFILSPVDMFFNCFCHL